MFQSVQSYWKPIIKKLTKINVRYLIRIGFTKKDNFLIQLFSVSCRPLLVWWLKQNLYFL